MKKHDNHIADGGYKSRKMVMAYVTLALIFLAFLLTAKYESLSVTFPELCMGLLGAAGIYVGGNWAVKSAAMKHAAKSQPEQPAEEAPPE